MARDPIHFGKYTLLDVLGEGAMARVYRAIRSGPMGFQKEVALKVMHPGVASKEKAVRALINEARMGGLLRHLNVVEIYEFDQVGDAFYVAMELVDGWTLAEVLEHVRNRGTMPPRIVAEIAAQICGGLAHAHTATDVEGRPLQLVHRDLKPSNVLLSEQGVVKLADFGIARAATNVFRTSFGVAKGTPVYMSPEQVRGRTLDHRSDLFSLGSVIAEMITGRVVFQDLKIVKVLQQVARADTSQVIEQVWARSPELVPVLHRAFARQPADRYQGAEEMGRELEELHAVLPGDERLRDWLPEAMRGYDVGVSTAEEMPPTDWDDWESGRISISLRPSDPGDSGVISVSLPPPEAPGDPLTEGTTEEAPLDPGLLDEISQPPVGRPQADRPVTGRGIQRAVEPGVPDTSAPDDRVTLEHPPPAPIAPAPRRHLYVVLVVIAALIGLAAILGWLAQTVV